MSDSPGLILWVRLLIRHYRFLGGVSLGSGLLTLAIVLILPRWYEARTSILPPNEDNPRVERMDQLKAVLRIRRFLPYSGEVTLSDIYLAILDSDTVARALIERYDLQDYYELESIQKTMVQLRSRTTIHPTLKRLLEVRVIDRDPVMAADLANAYVEELDRVFRETRSGSGMRQRIFLESRLEEAKAELDSAEARLLRLQQENRFVVLSRGLAEAATAAGELSGRKLALAIRLDMLTEMGVQSGPGRRELELELGAVEAEIDRLPELGMELARHLRDVTQCEYLQGELVRQLEAARIEEVRDTPTVDVLDIAVPPDRHKKPRRGLASIAGTFLGFGLAFAWVVYRDARR